jgi:hypothetical protein
MLKEKKYKLAEFEGENLDLLINEDLIDYLNLCFGTGNDSSDFWKEVIIPETAEYYSYPEEEIN